MPQSITPAILNAADQVEHDLGNLDVSTRALLQLLRAGQGGGGGGPFAPDDVADLALWLDASDATTITDAGAGAVSAWLSKDASSREFTQSTPGLRPTTGTTSHNGLNTIDFAGDYLVTTAAKSVWNFMHNGTKSTLFMVAKYGNVAEPDTIAYALGTSAAAGSQIGMTVFFDDRSSISIDKRVRTYVAAAVGAAVANNASNGVWTPNVYALLTHQLDAANATPASRSIITVNSGTAIAPNTAFNTPSAADSTGAFTIGADPAATNPLTGQIAEIAMYARDLTAGEIADVEGYLAAKWDITLA